MRKLKNRFKKGDSCLVDVRGTITDGVILAVREYGWTEIGVVSPVTGETEVIPTHELSAFIDLSEAIDHCKEMHDAYIYEATKLVGRMENEERAKEEQRYDDIVNEGRNVA